MGYQVDDLTIDFAARRVGRAGTVIPLKALSFDLLVTLVRAAPNLVSFEQLGERVWPGLVVSPETVVQRVKLLRDALGDDSRAPRYIEGVRGRGYRMLAEVRPLTERPGTPEEEEESPNVNAGVAGAEAATVSSPATTSPAVPRRSNRVPLRWIGGTLIMVMLLAASGAMVYYRGASKPAEGRSSEAAHAVIHSLVVLPLENLSRDKEQEYFADGITDALTTDLAQVGSLRVISRTSAMHFKGSNETLPQIGRDLQVDAVVEGAVSRGENRVRVTAQLVEASTDHHLWAKTYERDLKSVLSLQDEIAQDITEQIRVTLTPKERSLLIQAHTVDPEAYDAALRGWYWLQHASTLEGEQKALDYFQKAIAKDPSYAPAYAGVAASVLIFGLQRYLPRNEALTKARGAAFKALALDPTLAEAHIALALIKYWGDWDWAGAEAEYTQAIALSPNYAIAHSLYAHYLVAMGRLEEAMKEIERARDLDPFSVEVNQWQGQVLYHARRYDDALRQIQRTLEMFPDRGGLYGDLADVYEQKKMFAEAFAARQKALAPTLPKPNLEALAEAYKQAGYRGYLLKQIQILEQEPQLHAVYQWAYLAHLYAMLDDEAHAISCLERDYENHSDGILYATTAPELDSIRSSPRFRELVNRVRFPQPSSDKN